MGFSSRDRTALPCEHASSLFGGKTLVIELLSPFWFSIRTFAIVMICDVDLCGDRYHLGVDVDAEVKFSGSGATGQSVGGGAGKTGVVRPAALLYQAIRGWHPTERCGSGAAWCLVLRKHLVETATSTGRCNDLSQLDRAQEAAEVLDEELWLCVINSL